MGGRGRVLIDRHELDAFIEGFVGAPAFGDCHEHLWQTIHRWPEIEKGKGYQVKSPPPRTREDGPPRKEPTSIGSIVRQIRLTPRNLSQPEFARAGEVHPDPDSASSENRLGDHERYAFGCIKVARAQRAGETSRRKAAQGTEVEAMSRFIALHCGDETSALLSQHPNAFLLLTQIAMRAKWKDCSITRLKAGQAFIGNWREAGLKSEKAYRHAKTILSDCKLATFQGANKGTIATLADSKVFSISADGRGRTRGPS